MGITNLKYNIGLFEKQKELEQQLQFVEQQIKFQQEHCAHVGVTLGYVGLYSSRDTSVGQCLFCGKKSLEDFPLSICATTYKKEKYGVGSTKCERKGRLQELQELWISLANQNPDATEEELVEMMKEEIQKDAVQREGLEKKLQFSI